MRLAAWGGVDASEDPVVRWSMSGPVRLSGTSSTWEENVAARVEGLCERLPEACPLGGGAGG